MVHILNIIRYWTGSQCRDFRSGLEGVKRGDLVTTLAKQFWTRCSFVIFLIAILWKSRSAARRSKTRPVVILRELHARHRSRLCIAARATSTMRESTSATRCDYYYCVTRPPLATCRPLRDGVCYAAHSWQHDRSPRNTVHRPPPPPPIETYFRYYTGSVAPW